MARTPRASGRSTVLKRARAVAAAALDKKADDVVILDLRGRTSYADMLVLATGTSTRHVEAVGEGIEHYIKHRARSRPLGIEGVGQGRWVLVDWDDIVCHVFLEEVRAFYDLDGMWLDAPRVPLTPQRRTKRPGAPAANTPRPAASGP